MISSIAQSGSDTVITLQSGDQLTLTGVLASSVKVGNFVRTLTTPPLVPSQDAGGEPGGTPGADILTGSAGNDILDGLDGDDVITGGLGNDTINGGAGTDTAVFAGSIGSYAITGGPNGSVIVTGPDGTDTLTGIERVRFDDGTYVLATGFRYFEGTTGGDTLNGTAGSDEIRGLDGADILNGSGGDDLIIGGLGNDTMDGGAGDDIAVFSGSIANYTINSLPDGSVSVVGASGSDTIRNVERVQFDDGVFILATGRQYMEGSNNAETMIGSFRADEMYGLAGDDIINGEGGNDVIIGGLGNDTIDGGAGDDIAFFSGSISGYTISSVAGGVSVVGADGSDVIRNVERVQFADGVFILATGRQYLEGSNNAETMIGTFRSDELYGLGGDDTIFGEGGDDVFFGGLGDDVMDGGAGDDIAVFSGSIADYTINSVANGVSVVGADGSDVIRNIERVQFADGVFILASGYQYMEGSNNAETIIGSFRSDEIYALAGDDTIRAEGGDDTIIAGLGDDYIDGGAGIDLAVFSGTRDSYTITETGGETRIVGADGSDRLINVERLQFSDGIYDITGDPLAAPAFETQPVLADDLIKRHTGEDETGPQVQPGVVDVFDKADSDLPLVLPGAIDDDFLEIKPNTDSAGPQIQPGVFDDFGLSVGVGSDFVLQGGIRGSGGFGGQGDHYSAWGHSFDLQRALSDHEATTGHPATDPWG